MIKLISKIFKRIAFSIEQEIFALACIISLLFLFVVFIIKDNIFDSYGLKKREIKKEDWNNDKNNVEESLFI